MKARVLLAGLFHQTNAFVGGRTTLDEFEIRRGEEILRGNGSASPVSGVLEVARENDWELLPALDVRAMSGATVADSVVELFWSEFLAVADEAAVEGIDGIFLLFHGAMVSESSTDVEGEILWRIRGTKHLADAPICGVFDLHANFTEAMARQSDGLIACRNELGADAGEAARDAAILLDGLMRTERRPVSIWEHPPIMWPLSSTATSDEPMLVLEERARELEAEIPDVVAVNVLAGFPYSDSPEAGVSFSAVADGDLELAHSALKELNVVSSSRREAGMRRGMELDEAIARLDEHEIGPVLLLEPSDNVAAGAPGDGTLLLRALLENDVPNAGVIIHDPETVMTLADARPGEYLEVAVGGKSGEIASEPLPLEVELVSKSDGMFVPELETGGSARVYGGTVEMGSCAVVCTEGVTVLLTSRRTPPFDLGQWRSQGVNPEYLFAIGLKAAFEHRPAYEPIAAASYVIDSPGPCAENLKLLPFERVSRPVYPLDDM